MTSSPIADPAAGKTATVVTQTRVRPERNDDFARWQQRVNEVVAGAPGFVDQQAIPPSPPVQVDWVIVQRFASVDAARAWLGSDERRHLLVEAQPWLVGPDDIHLIVDDGTGQPPASVSAVIATRVKPGQDEAYRAWSQRIASVEARFPGFQGVKINPPIPGVQSDWVAIVRFDGEPHLNAWLESPDRQKLLDEAAAFTTDSHYRTVRSGFEQWFRMGAPDAALPPAWKQNAITLLALYPVVFLFGVFVQTPLLQGRAGLPFWLTLFIGNVASVTILNWLVPWLSHRFAWWLKPAETESRNLTMIGVAIVVALYALFMLLFAQFFSR